MTKIALHDKNLSWEPPVGFDFLCVEPMGSYLVVTYARHQAGDEVVRGGVQFVTIYLESQGREVLRTVEEILEPVVKAPLKPKPVGRWFRFKNAFYLVLTGLQEMSKCHKRS